MLAVLVSSLKGLKKDRSARPSILRPWTLEVLEELEQLQAAVLLMARRQGLLPPEEGEDVAG